MATIASLMTQLSIIIPVDVLAIIAIRLLIMLIMSLIGLIAKLKTAIKWW